MIRRNEEIHIGIGLDPSYCSKGYGKASLEALITTCQERYKGIKINRYKVIGIENMDNVAVCECFG